MYFLAVNKARPHADPKRIGEIVPDHIAWVKERTAAGEVALAGKWGESGGIVIVRAGTDADARAIAMGDPLARSGLFSVEIDRFYPDVKSPRFE